LGPKGLDEEQVHLVITAQAEVIITFALYGFHAETAEAEVRA